MAETALRFLKVEDEAAQGYEFGKCLKVPEELLKQKRNQYALFMMVHSSRVTRDRSIDTEFYDKLGPDANQLYQNYFKIYFENSSKKRLLFFCDPLI